VQVIPAVDIMRGKVVRLQRGAPSSRKFYEGFGDPLAAARKWEAQGARIIHIVDLDAALELGNNTSVIGTILQNVEASVQIGGGIRTTDMARALLKMGADRIVLGSLAFKDPSAVRTLVNEYGKDRIIVALDHVNGVIMVQGWKDNSGITVDDAASRFSELGVELFVVTSIRHDGTMIGPDLETTARLCRDGFNVIAAGGIGNLEGLVSLKRLGVHSVVIGKALYEGSFTLAEALRVAEE